MGKKRLMRDKKLIQREEDAKRFAREAAGKAVSHDLKDIAQMLAAEQARKLRIVPKNEGPAPQQPKKPAGGERRPVSRPPPPEPPKAALPRYRGAGGFAPVFLVAFTIFAGGALVLNGALGHGLNPIKEAQRR